MASENILILLSVVFKKFELIANEFLSVICQFFLTSSSCHPKIFVKEFSYFLMSCHQHCLGVNLLVQR